MQGVNDMTCVCRLDYNGYPVDANWLDRKEKVCKQETAFVSSWLVGTMPSRKYLNEFKT